VSWNPPSTNKTDVTCFLREKGLGGKHQKEEIETTRKLSRFLKRGHRTLQRTKNLRVADETNWRLLAAEEGR